MLIYILASRVLIGFVIDVSTLRMHWELHGFLIGAVAGLPFAVDWLLEESNLGTVIAALILGAACGLMIEYFTSVVFGARTAKLLVRISRHRIALRT